MSIANAVNDAANAEVGIPKLGGVLLPSAGIKAYVRRLPTREARAELLAETKALPKDQRRGHLIAAASCYASGSEPADIPADHEAEYAARLAKAKPADLERLFRIACHLNGTTTLEVLA